MANLDDLYGDDERYQAFEDHENGILVSLAGPGTGKTYSFLRRIQALTDHGSVEPASIAYLTFIREISKAFTQDYEEEFGSEVAESERPRISTLHSFACRLIRNRGFSIGFDGPLYFTSIADDRSFTSEVFLTDLLPFIAHLQLSTLPQLRAAVKIVKDAWCNDQPPDELDEPIPSLLKSTLQLARSYRLIDWDHAIPIAHGLYQKPKNRQQWISQIDHYMIDEFQDFNQSEQAFILTIASNVKSMVIVGDNCQSIFKGRGGSPEGIRELFECEDHDSVTLVKCRRCRASILQHINLFLEKLCPGTEPMLPHYDGGQLNCFRFKSSKAEIAFLEEFLNDMINRLPAEPRQKDGVVCLFPTLKALGFYFESLRESVSCYIRGSQASDQREWLSVALQLVSHPGQRFLERLILQSFTDFKPRHRKAMVHTIFENDISPVAALSILRSEQELKGKAEVAASQFVDLCTHLSSQEPRLVAKVIAAHLDLDIDTVTSEITDFIAGIGDHNQDEAIEGVCDHLLPDTALPDENPNAVRFLTMHGSKGLTRHTVVLPGLEDAWLPGQAGAEDVEERARLFYVALSRATHRVQITYPQNRARGDSLNYATPGRGKVSRFVVQSGIPDVYHA